jgi:hypothetical protein
MAVPLENSSSPTRVGAVKKGALRIPARTFLVRVEGGIEVLPPSLMDEQIRIAEYRAIYGDPALSTRYGFRALPSTHIIVKNGHVRLEGVVANKADKDIVNVRANGVPDVFPVDSRQYRCDIFPAGALRVLR